MLASPYGRQRSREIGPTRRWLPRRLVSGRVEIGHRENTEVAGEDIASGAGSVWREGERAARRWRYGKQRLFGSERRLVRAASACRAVLSAAALVRKTGHAHAESPPACGTPGVAVSVVFGSRSRRPVRVFRGAMFRWRLPRSRTDRGQRVRRKYDVATGRQGPPGDDYRAHRVGRAEPDRAAGPDRRMGGRRQGARTVVGAPDNCPRRPLGASSGDVRRFANPLRAEGEAIG